MNLHVSRECINAGDPLSETGCPIALAIIKVLKDDPRVDEIRTVAVGAGVAEVEYVVKRTVKLPKVAQKFITDFDNGRPVKPLTLVLR